MSTIITNVAVVTMNETHEVIQHGFAAWKGGEITAVGTMDMLEAMIAEERDDETEDETGESLRLIDGKGGILMPGMVNLHAHMGMIPFRGSGRRLQGPSESISCLWNRGPWMPSASIFPRNMPRRKCCWPGSPQF